MGTTIPGAAHPDRLTALDASNLRIEDHGVPMHVAALAFLDGAPLLDGAGELLIDQVRRLVDERSRRAARLRQVLVASRRGAGPPAWQDDGAFDITRHVRTARVPAPGDEAGLLALCGELNRPRLDRSHPLWEMWLLTGLADGRVALLIRVHHVVADGIALLSLLGSLLDPGPGAASMSRHPARRRHPAWRRHAARARTPGPDHRPGGRVGTSGRRRPPTRPGSGVVDQPAGG